MSEIARRRLAALLLVLGAVLAALVIADVGPFEDPLTVEEEARATAEEFFAAAGSGDGERFCELLTDEARASLRGQVAALLGADDAPGCERGFEVVSGGLEGAELTVRYVSVSGDEARVEARLRLGDRPAQLRTIELVERDGAWRVSDPG